MNRRALLLIAASAGVLAVAFLTRGGGSASSGGRPTFRPVKAGPSSSAPAASARSGYDNFKLVHTRNVFDPDRRPLRTGPPAATPPPARSDYVALTGTFFDGERKQLAFFSGSRAEYNKVLAVHDQIAGATINKITGANVEVVRNGRPITVAVGQTVPFDNSAPTAAPGAAAIVPAPGAGAPASAPGAGAAAPAVPNGNPGAVPASPDASPSSSKLDEVRRRMEERRRQEQK